jgi:DNA polymerase
MKMSSAYSELAKLVARAMPVLKHGYAIGSPPPMALASAPDLQSESPQRLMVPKQPARVVPVQEPPKAPVFAPMPGSAPVVLEYAGLDTGQAIELVNNTVKKCEACGLCAARTKAVPGTGSIHPVAMVIGEAPGADEDRLGLPFVGAAGQFLDKWLEAIGLSRYSNIYITNTLKCRPPQNRDPLPEESAACAAYLKAQIAILKPKAILTLGRHASAWLMGEDVTMAAIHGKPFRYGEIPWMPTYHSSAVLRKAELKRPVWEDLKGFKDLYSR